jgi:inosine-uridine nucleoside N-ribohydrolase
MKYFKSLICILFIAGNSGPAILYAQDLEKPVRIWFDTDIMIGLPERAPREVDDGVTLIMALALPQIEIVGISTITYSDYGYDITRKILNYYAPERNIPVFKGSDSAADVGVENDATRALTAALQKEKLTILALGPATNIATVLKNNPELASQMTEIIFCAGRTENFPFQPGLGLSTVGDYNFEKDVESFRIILDSDVKVVLSGFECSAYLLIGRPDIQFLKNGNEADQWLYSMLVPWQQRALKLFGVEGFIPYDVTPLGHITHPQFFKYYRDIPVIIRDKKNDATIGQNRAEFKKFLEVSYDFDPKWKVDYAYKTLPGFEEIVIETMKAPEK